MMPLTYVELFAGAGGLSLGLEAAGFHAAAHCEIEPHARAVLRHRWPDVPLFGDVTQVDGTQFAGVTLVSGGSPCQDLSVAGKRAGLAGARSGLFHQQVRIWRESGAPYFLWENVLGALSSNNGRDFAAVLSTLVGATIPVPADGWRGGGVAAGRDAVAAWRVLDLQHFGPPQRRVRVFIVAARAGGVDPAEVLALGEGLCRHPSPRQQSRQRAANGTRTSTESGLGVAAFNSYQRTVEEVVSGVRVNSSAEAGVLTIGIDDEKNASQELMGTLKARTKSGGSSMAIVAFDNRPQIMEDETTNTLTTEGMRNPMSVVCTTGDVTHALTHEGADASEDGTGRGTPVVVGTLTVGGRDKGDGDSYDNTPITVQQRPDDSVLPSLPASLANSATGHNKDELVIASSTQWNAAHDTDTAFTLTTMHDPQYLVHPTLNTTHFGKHFGCNQHVNELGTILPAIGRPRRLTPLECERLMSWPDQWTATGVKEDGTEYALSDTARYRLCGNGVGSVCVAWFAKRLADLIEAQ